MDKYELNLKIEEIKRLASIKSYKEAAEMAKSISWYKVKDWSALATAISVHEAVEDYEEARDMAILAYNRNLGGRNLVYKLTELLIKLGQLEDAQGLYEEYERMSSHDVNRYILQYDLRKAQKASDNELVEILEEYKVKEIDEKYMYELAELYSKTGRINECIEACDELAMLFQDGIYVEKAMLLKSKVGGALTKHQTQQLEREKNKESKVSKDILFEQQSELIRMQHDDIDEALEEDEKKSRGLLGLFSKPAKSARKEDIDIYDNKQDMEAAKEKQKNIFTDNTTKQENTNNADELGNNNISYNLREFVLAKVRESEEKSRKEEEPLEELQTFEVFLNDADTKTSDSIDKEDINKQEQIKVQEYQEYEQDYQEKAQDYQETAVTTESENQQNEKKESSEIPESLMKLISNARKSIDTSYKEINKEQEQERIKQELKKQEKERQERKRQEQLMKERDDEMVIEEVKMPDNSIYDTQNLQDTIAQTLAEFLDDDIEKLRPDPSVKDYDLENGSDDEQIEGQISLADWVESVKEQKYGHQSTKEFSKQELLRMLDEKDEKSAAYEMLMKKQKEEAQKAADIDFDEVKKKEYEQMIVEAVKTDLAFRTGKATRSLEEDIIRLMQSDHIKENIKESIKRIERDGKIEKPTDIPLMEVSHTKKSKKKNHNTDKISDEEISEVLLHTIQMQVISDDVLRQYVTKELEKKSDSHEEVSSKKFPTEEQFSQRQNLDKDNLQESDFNEPVVVEEESEPLVEEFISENTFSDEGRRIKRPQFVNPIVEDEEEEVEECLKLEGELAKIFRKYREMPGIESQLATYFASIDDEMNMIDSSVGNILITGNSSSDKTDLARNIVRALNYLYPDMPKKIAKTTGDSINHRGIAKAMSKLRGTVLIVEGAGSIQPKRIGELMECLEQNTGRMIVIFEDSDAQMNVLLNFNPELTSMFNHRIVLKQYTVNELVEMARKFARKRQYEVDDDALLALYLKINDLHSMTDNIKLDDIKEIINKAIAHSEKRAARRFFGGVKKKRGEQGDIFFLSESDFKD